jgi:hypothetical protein
VHRDDEGAGSFPPTFHFISRFPQSMVYHFPTEDSLFNFVQGVGQKSGGDEWQLVIDKTLIHDYNNYKDD